MTIKRNAEGYYDPTAGEALLNIMREERKKANRALVYICSPYAGDIEGNARRAQTYCRFAVSQNYIPLAPHLYFPQFMDEDSLEERSLGIAFGLVLPCLSISAARTPRPPGTYPAVPAQRRCQGSSAPGRTPP